MLLAIDIGNSNIVMCLFRDNRQIRTVRFGSQPVELRRQIQKLKQYRIEGVIVSSVVPDLDKLLARTVKDVFWVAPYFVTSSTFKGIMPIKLKKHVEVGADRLVDAFAARELYGKPSIVVDFGTATTFCAVNGKGEYLGGAISPGVAISRDALHEKTAKLPLVELRFPKKAIGEDTVSAMRSGILYGYVGIVEEIVKRFRSQMGSKAKVVATGGLAGIIAGETDIIDIVDPGLTLKGLKMIWEKLWAT